MNRIKQLRKQKGITVKDLAEKLGIAQSMLTNYENGGSTPRNSAFWEELAEFFDVSVGYLMGVTEALPGAGAAPENTIPLRFVVLNMDSIEKIIQAKKPIEVTVDTPETYALLANLAQLPDEEIAKLLKSVQKTIRTKYAGRLTEIRLPDMGNAEE